MDERITNITTDISKVAADVRISFGNLSPAQLNWKPDDKSWSVAQCLDHLITTHRQYFPLFKKMAAGDAKPTFWEKASPLSGFFGRFLIKSLDVAEAKADALRLNPSTIDLDELLHAIIDLYEPSMNDKGLRIRLHSAAPVQITGDEGLMHRMVANLLDNELKHLPAGCSVDIYLQENEKDAMLTLRDNGPGFDQEVRARFPGTAVRQAVLLQYGDDPLIEPGDLLVRVLLDEPDGPDDDWGPAMTAFEQANEAAIGRFRGYLAVKLREIMAVEYVFSDNPVTWDGEGPRGGMPVAQRLSDISE